MDSYERRIIDDELDRLELPALALEGPKAIGKTWTASQRARTVHDLNDAEQLALARAQPQRLLRGEKPVFIDEWQHYEPSWNLVRGAVNDDYSPNQFFLAGSMNPLDGERHSGAGRITSLRMRPLSFSERQAEVPSVRLAALLSGHRGAIEGETSIDLTTYVDEIVRSGFPAIRQLNGPSLRLQLESYVDRIVEKDFNELGRTVRRPAALRAWMRAFAAASSTTTTWEKVRDAANPGLDAKPARSTTEPYREVLEHLFILDDLPAWIPSMNHLREVGEAPKHHLADPALAVALLGSSKEQLLSGGQQPLVPRDDGLLGALFESLVTLSVRVYAQAAEAKVHHLRTFRGRQEIDLIVERRDGGVVAIEVKSAQVPDGKDFQHLHWLRQQIGDRLLDGIVVCTGRYAYRQKDGFGVVPLALLGP